MPQAIRNESPQTQHMHSLRWKASGRDTSGKGLWAAPAMLRTQGSYRGSNGWVEHSSLE